MVQFDFTAKVALITGGTSGIGEATARAFAQAGATVMITARNADRGRQVAAALNGAGMAGKVDFVAADLAIARDVDALFGTLTDRHGRLDVLVNNAAGEAGVGKPLHEFGEEELEEALAVNCKAVWRLMKRAITQMLGQKPAGGSIVNVSTINALGGVAGGSLYAAGKAAALALTKSAAQEYGRFGIKINALVPGAFDTPLLQKAFQGQTDGSAEALEAIRSQYLQMIPAGRIGAPDEAAEGILWLCSEGTPYLSGHSLIMDGGMSSRFR
ncbi:SDR family NAD(P)-dependent oxidoreductase [Larkinella soli]|uniref:SDR family NAD(P)-dependent oxidoreductase n=1 Tax=Larkinella soli TaxID=1770527 RepID=UPI000FFB670C|nr:SDR family oxidoreductase [Larkinella soli]